MSSSVNEGGAPAPAPASDLISSVEHVFNSYERQIDEVQNIRESIRETTKPLERFSKQLQSILQRIHHHQIDLNKICEDARTLVKTQVNPLWVQLETKIPPGQYYHYNDTWRFLSQRISAACALIYYLETEQLADRAVVGQMMGLNLNSTEAKIYLDLEDYLQGLLQMASELSRFTVNCVTNGDYSRPARIGKFVTELNNGFRELNLKNDFLRKRYDVLKYDIKKIEEVIYDVSIRGLANTNANASVGATTANLEAPSSTTLNPSDA